MMDKDRFAALEKRVTELEAHTETSGALQPLSPDLDNDPLWALIGLRARAAEPGAVMLVGHVLLPDGRTAQWQQAKTTDELLDSDWTRSAATLAALGQPVRVRLLQQVLTGTSTANELTRLDGVGTSGQVYHHLRELISTGWLTAVGGGRHEVPVARVVPLLALIQGAQG